MCTSCGCASKLACIVCLLKTKSCVGPADERPDIPDIVVNFHHDFHFEVILHHVSEISAEGHEAAVRFTRTRVLLHDVWLLIYCIL